MVVRRVRVPEVHVQEPVVLVAVGIQPGPGRRIHLVGVLQAALARVVGLAEAEADLVGGVAVGEGADHAGVVAGTAQHRAEALLRHAGAKAAIMPFQRHVGIVAAMIDHTGANPEHAGEERGAAGQAGRVAAVEVGEAHALGGQRVDIGRRLAVIAIAGKVVRAQRININIENAHE